MSDGPSQHGVGSVVRLGQTDWQEVCPLIGWSCYSLVAARDHGFKKK